MNVKKFGVVLLVFGVYMSFVSAGFSGDIFQKITGNVVNEAGENVFDKVELGMISCEQARDIFGSDFENYEIPNGVPFKNEVFSIYIDDEFFLSVELVNKKIDEVLCKFSNETTYNIYVSSSLIAEVIGADKEINPINYYIQKRKSGELKIRPVGIVRKIKMGFINFGLNVVSWFS